MPPQRHDERAFALHAGASSRHAFLLGLCALGLTSVTALAGPFSNLIIFGDSLSDVGNIADATFGIYPGQYYTDDRFSNGPVYAEGLSLGLGLGMTEFSREGGNDFAYGGAQTTSTGGFNGIFIHDVDEQVDDFLGSRTVDPAALFLVYAGANDLVGGQTNVNTPVNSLATDIGQLIAAGARQFLIPTLPPLGFVPRFNDAPDTMNTRTANFNAALTAALANLLANHSDVRFHRFDVTSLFEEALAEPSAFGLTNVTDAAAPGLQPGMSNYDTSKIAAEPNQYLFWDDLHPTSAVHAILAQRALATLLLPGDYNGDGAVDTADYVVWRKSRGTVYAQADFDDWRAHFGQTAGSGATGSASAFATAPEPSACLLLVICAIWLAAPRPVAYNIGRQACHHG